MHHPMHVLDASGDFGWQRKEWRPVYVQSVMHKRIMVKIGESKTRKLSNSGNRGGIITFCGNRELYKFCINRGKMQYASVA